MIADWIRVKINGSQAYQCRQDCSGLVVLGLLVDYSVITVMYIVQVQQKRKGATPLGLARGRASARRPEQQYNMLFKSATEGQVRC